jgi:hypothetical protein
MIESSAWTAAPGIGHAGQVGVFAGMLGAWYPRDYIVGVIDDIDEAERAAEELRRVGFPEADVRLFPSEEVVEGLRMIDAQRNLFQRVGAAIQREVTEEGAANKEYDEEARAGRQILTALAVEPEEIERARKVFVAHGARRIMHYKKWTITDLR